MADGGDLDEFADAYLEGDAAADLNLDELVNSDDFDTFVESFDDLGDVP
jgi:hypothetical protein